MSAALALLVLSAAAADAVAVALERVAPAYPPQAMQRKLDGCVVLSFTIDADGRPADVLVIDSQPKGIFDAATLKVFGQWRFEQPQRPGRYAQAVNFRLKERKPAYGCKPLPTFAELNPEAPPATRELRVLGRVTPEFPRGGPEADGGCVTVRFQIKHDGFVGEVQVLEARPETLAEPTVAALRQWHFQSFPPPALWSVQTFNFAPEQVRMPEDFIRAAYADLDGSALRNTGCGDKAGALRAAPDGSRP